MTFGFMHLIGAWLAGKGYEYTSKNKLTHLAWGMLLLGGILPDIDLLLDWTIGTEIHRSFSHSLFFMIMAPIVLYIIFKFIKSKGDLKNLPIFLGIGIAVHLILDIFFAPGINLLWPYNLFVSYWGVGFYTSLQLHAGAWTYDALKSSIVWMIVDMALGVAWLAYFVIRKRIKF